MGQELTTTILDDLVIGSARGRKAAPLEAYYMRDLDDGDLELILNPPPKGSAPAVLKTLRQTHHTLARLLAEGRPPGECSLITGYSPSRISILQNDPAFAELVAYYAQQKEAVYLDVHQRLAGLGLSCIEELQERLEQTPDELKTRELMDLAALCLDRSIAPSKGAPAGGVGGRGNSFTIQFVQPKDAPAPGAVVIDVEPQE